MEHVRAMNSAYKSFRMDGQKKTDTERSLSACRGAFKSVGCQQSSDAYVGNVEKRRTDFH